MTFTIWVHALIAFLEGADDKELEPTPSHLSENGKRVAGAEWERVVLRSDDETESSEPTPCSPPLEWR